MKDVTVLIKTMDRKKSLSKLVKSIVKYYPEIKIMIADDGKESAKDFIMHTFSQYDITYFELPYDSGLSYGRNYLLNKVITPYFLLCDDDFQIDDSLDLSFLQQMLEEKELDILGGYIRNYKIVKSWKDKLIVLAQKILHYELNTNYIGEIKQMDKELLVQYKIKAFPEFTMTDLCPNFFLAKTKKVQAMHGWDNALKLQEHTEFFVRAKRAGLRVGSTNKMSVKHFPMHSKGYAKKRGRDFSSLFLQKHGFQKATYLYDDPSRNHIEYFDEAGNFQVKQLEKL